MKKNPTALSTKASLAGEPTDRLRRHAPATKKHRNERTPATRSKVFMIVLDA